MLKWERKGGPGNYESADGRWTLTADPLKPKEWTLFDRSRKDPVVPEFNWMQRVQSLAHGKSVAERELRKERSALKDRVKAATLTQSLNSSAPLTAVEKSELVDLLFEIYKVL